jgi:deoxycytidylate deaminase
MSGLEEFFYRDAELVLGLVGPVGTELDKFVGKVETALTQYGYRTHPVRLSALAAKLMNSKAPPGESEFDRAIRLMDAGDALRMRRPEILALAAAHTIRQFRDQKGADEPLRGTAHLLRSLKHPAEVLALRRIYGAGFFLIGVVTSPAQRAQLLETERGCTPQQSRELRDRDEHGGEDGGENGQRARDTFQLADVFLRAEDVDFLNRFFRLVFGAPHETPEPDEHAMFLAFSAALRSADLSRQVGAVVTSDAGDVVAIGMNDVPLNGGGLCWPGAADHRDHVLGHDTNERQRTEIVDELIAALRPDTCDEKAWKEQSWKTIKRKGAAVLDITEYGRAVHAEMEALMSCARTGARTRGSTLYSTTFPCHNCAKHIIAAGVRRVVYVEPYPKSQASKFYEHMIDVEGVEPPGKKEPSEDRRTGRSRTSPKVSFEPFVGVGPRRFLDLFSVGLSSGLAVKRKVEGGEKRTWIPGTAAVRVPLLPNSYLKRESSVTDLMSDFESKPPGPVANVISRRSKSLKRIKKRKS